MANGTNSIAIGNGGTEATANTSIAIGQAATVASNRPDSIAIGNGATVGSDANGGEGVAIGAFAQSQFWRAMAVGYKAIAGAVSSTALGRGAQAMFSHTVAIGRGAFTSAASQFVLGFQGGNAASHFYLDNGHTATYTEPTDGGTITRIPASCPATIHGMSAKDTSASPVGDIAGGDLVLSGGQGTGTGAGGKVKLRVAPAGSTGTTENTLVDGLIVYSDKSVEIPGDRIRILTNFTPASAAAAGTKGDIAIDGSFIYICTATNTWKRSAIATW